MAIKNSGRISDYGLDAICEDISDGVTMRAISEKLGVTPGALTHWIANDDQRSARVNEARRQTAILWDEDAVAELKASTPETLCIAREVASHYRWRASKIAPAVYGDKVQVNASLTLESLVNQSLQISRDTLSPPVIEGQAEPEE